jgi:hypothetical protein
LTNNFTLLGAILGGIGSLSLAFLRPRLFWSLFLLYALPIPFVLAYGKGEQAAFLLPSFLIFALFLGYAFYCASLVISHWSLAQPPSSLLSRKTPPTHYALRTTHYALRFIPLLLFLLLLPVLLIPQTRYNLNWLDVKWSRPIYAEWADNLNHPLPEGATMLARWGDLTSFWYMQYAEGRRPDLRGLYPPLEQTVTAWYAQGGKNLYIAGPLESWAEGVEKRYQLLPWGRLVRIAPREVAPETLLPTLSHPVAITFADKLQLIGADFAPQVAQGGVYPVTLTWQVLTELPPQTTISLRLTQDEAIISQLDDPLVSGWFPRETLPTGQYLLSYPLLPVPLGLLPGKYHLQMVVYSNYKQPWPTGQSEISLDLSEVEVTLPPPD